MGNLNFPVSLFQLSQAFGKIIGLQKTHGKVDHLAKGSDFFQVPGAEDGRHFLIFEKRKRHSGFRARELKRIEIGLCAIAIFANIKCIIDLFPFLAMILNC